MRGGVATMGRVQLLGTSKGSQEEKTGDGQSQDSSSVTVLKAQFYKYLYKPGMWVLGRAEAPGISNTYSQPLGSEGPAGVWLGPSDRLSARRHPGISVGTRETASSSKFLATVGSLL